MDTYPVLRYLPDLLVPAQRKARDFHRAESKRFLRLRIGMKEKVREGKAPVSPKDWISGVLLYRVNWKDRDLQ